MQIQDVKTIIKQKKAIIFDLFHTLTAPEIVLPEGQSTSQILGLDSRRWNEQLMEKSRSRLIGEEKDPFKIMQKLAHAIDPHISAELIHKAVQNRVKRFETALIKMPENSITTIQQLKQMGKKLALVSNADVIEAAAWELSPVAHYFNKVLFSCYVGYIKPEIEIYELCLQQLGEVAKDCIFVGDGGSNEFIGARKAGLSIVMVTGIIEKIWPYKIEAIKQHADFIIGDLKELVDI
jgi:putative hydrolase of the HAD superfamily